MAGYSFEVPGTSLNRSDWFYCIAHLFLVLIGLCLFSLLLFAVTKTNRSCKCYRVPPIPTQHDSPPPSPLGSPFKAKIIIYCLQRYSVILCLKLPFQEDIKGHPFFRNIDWQLLYDKKIEPPYNPNVVSWILKPLRVDNIYRSWLHALVSLTVVERFKQESMRRLSKKFFHLLWRRHLV